MEDIRKSISASLGEGGFRSAGGYDGLTSDSYLVGKRCPLKKDKMCGTRAIPFCTNCSNTYTSLVDTLANKNFWLEIDTNAKYKKQIFSARLIPLNKMHPATPRVADYRPIVVMAHSIKFV